MNYTQAWKLILNHLEKIQDTTFRNILLATFRRRAIQEWGFDPETSYIAKDSDVKLDDWEKEFLLAINDAAAYGINPRTEEQKATKALALASMTDFIRHGGTLTQIPEDILTQNIIDLYFEALHNETTRLCQAMDELK